MRGSTVVVTVILHHGNRNELFDNSIGLLQRVIWCYGIYQHQLNNELQQKGYHPLQES